MTDKELEILKTANDADVRNREVYQTYCDFCARLGIQPAEYGQWLIHSEKRPMP